MPTAAVWWMARSLWSLNPRFLWSFSAGAEAVFQAFEIIHIPPSADLTRLGAAFAIKKLETFMKHKNLILKTLFLGLLLIFLSQCSGDHAVIDFPGAIIPADPDINDNPDSGDNSGTITGNPTSEPAPSVDPSATDVEVTSPDTAVEEPAVDSVGSSDSSAGDNNTETPVLDEDDGSDDLADNDAEDDDDSQIPLPDDSFDMDGPGYDGPVGPLEGDDDTEVVPPGADLDEEDVLELDYTTDADGDGLATAIDPRPSIADAWGYIDGSDASLPCIYEQVGYVYHYIEGHKPSVIIRQIEDDNKAILSDKTYRAPTTTIKVQALPKINAFGVEYENGINVEGLVDRDEARLPTVNCVAGDYDFTHGLYVRLRNWGKVQLTK